MDIKVGEHYEDEYSYKIEIIGVGDFNLAYRSIIDGRFGAKCRRKFEKTHKLIKEAPKPLPADWRIDSSLKTWFPITADELVQAYVECSRMRAELQELRLQKITEFGEFQTLCENADDAWEYYSKNIDMYLPKTQPKMFKDGFKAGVLSVCKQ